MSRILGLLNFEPSIFNALNCKSIQFGKEIFLLTVLSYAFILKFISSERIYPMTSLDLSSFDTTKVKAMKLEKGHLSTLNNDILEFFSEILVINNQSTDAGEEQVINFAKNNPTLPIKLIRNNKNFGLGGSHKIAFQYAIDNNFDYVCILHGDDQAEINNLIPLLTNNLHKEYDCLLGARFMLGSELKGYSKFRTFGNYVFNFIFTLALGQNIYDLGSGLNLYKTRRNI